jgi:prevent-host-death family protein
MKTSAKDLRIHTKRILEAVERGEEVTITHRGRPCAKLVPLHKQRGNAGRTAKLPLFGIWKDNKAARDVATYLDKLRQPRR